MSIACPNCGKINEDTTELCSCGHYFKSQQDNPSKPEQDDTDKDASIRKQASSSAAVVGLIIGLLIAFGLGAFLYSTSGGFNIFFLLIALLAGAIMFLPVFLVVNFFTQKSMIQSDPLIKEIKILEKRTDNEAIKSLIKALNDKNEYIWLRALRALTLHLNDNTIKEIIRKIVQTKGNWKIVNIIKKLKLKEAVQPLIDSMNTPGKDTIISLNIVALGEIGDVAAFQPVLKALGNDDTLYQCATDAIKKIIDTHQKNDFLFEAKTNKNHVIRKMIAALLGYTGSKKNAHKALVESRVIETLTSFLLDDHNDVRKEAANSFKKLGETKWSGIIKGDPYDFKRLGKPKDENLLKAVLGKLANEPVTKMSINNMIEVLESYSEKEAKDAIIRLEKELALIAAKEEAERKRREEKNAEEMRQRPRTGGIIVCPVCKKTYDRDFVINSLKQQSPEIFNFSNWSTKFYCKNCRNEIWISGK
ncbi:MAG: hypothetical protein JXK95_09105 [Bacteroidales bacterium]|nr:hypothetical protein [Bacteroidales bacterium]